MRMRLRAILTHRNAEEAATAFGNLGQNAAALNRDRNPAASHRRESQPVQSGRRRQGYHPAIRISLVKRRSRNLRTGCATFTGTWSPNR